MTQGGDAGASVVLRGSPLGLSAVVATTRPAARGARRNAQVSPMVPAEPVQLSSIRLQATSRATGARGSTPALDAIVSVTELVAGAAMVRVDLPRETPPGTYEGTATVGGVETRVVVEVEPDVFLRLFPELLNLTVEPGGAAQVSLTLVNMGNAPAEIRGAYLFGVFEIGGAERAVTKLIAEVPDGQRRIDQFADAVVESHGGLIRVKVDEGAGVLAPGEVRELRLTLAIPDRLEPGRVYSGTWAFHNLGYFVKLTAGEARRGPVARRRRNKEAPA